LDSGQLGRGPADDVCVGTHRIGRFAFVGLAVVLLGLTGVSVVGTVFTRESAQAARDAEALARAYDRAHDALALEENAEQDYRLEPDPSVIDEHDSASRAMLAALAEIKQRGTTTDRDLVRQLEVLQQRYLAGMEDLFKAAERGDEVEVKRIDLGTVDPREDEIRFLVQRANVEHAENAAEAAERLDRIEGIVFTASTSAFGVGVVLLAAFAVIAIGYQRRLLRQAASSEYQARHDALTGLPNRRFFTERTDAALAEAAATGGDVSMLMLDLDRFKEVNDTLGHQYGDELLRQVAARTAAAVRTTDTVARLSGDEFAVLLPSATAAAAEALAQRLLTSLHRSFSLGDVTVDVEASVGIATAPEHADSGEALLRCADIAMYAAKDAKVGALMYRPAMHAEDGSRLLILGDLRRALDTTDQLTVHYQPKIRLTDGGVSGVEGLIRWQHPLRGNVPPNEFIPVAETTGLITRLTLYVLRMAVAQGRAWLDAGLATPIAVNLSPRCLLDQNLVTQVTDVLAEYALPAELLRLEVTESAVMANPALAIDSLTELHRLGLGLSIDDYGTGYSSMAYLKRLPVDELKVDRTFVRDVDTDREDVALVRGAIELGHSLGMSVVAEGVESAGHATTLRGLGCDVAQGYHYARPMPAADLTDWMRTRQRLATTSPN
jgi:diguanylate cyclase (GGDEF)-like protein